MRRLSAVVVTLSWLGLLLLSSCGAEQELVFAPHSAAVLIEQTADFTITLQGDGSATDLQLHVNISDPLRAELNVTSATISPEKPVGFRINGTSPGHVTVNATAGNLTAFYHLTIQHSFEWGTFSEVVGWLYFVAWSVSFYPQIYDNWKRKSVVGLNLDFLALNLMGFFLYSLFNGGMFWNAEIRQEYEDKYPGSLNPVLINDIVFSFHAFVAVVLTIVQCFFYERGEQTVSLVAKGLLGVFTAFLVISAICSGTGVLQWLEFLYYCSYVKLAITLIKYIPQAYMNFRRKSTVGWSIGNVFLDFTGGMLSMLQMIINSWNFDDWDSIFGDPTKFGLGLFSVIFDVFFLVQHYILYRHGEYYADFPASTSNSRSELVS